jgi:hypothetical protein
MSRPTDTIIVPGVKLASAIVIELLTERETFTVQPSPTQDGVWHIGVFESGKAKVVAVAQAMGY